MSVTQTSTIFGQTFANKRVVVVGAAQGIGRMIAAGFADHGAAVIAVDIQAESIQKTAAELNDQGLEVYPEVADITVADDVAAMFTRIRRRWDTLDVLVNNAGVISIHPIMETTTADFTRVCAVNTIGMFTTCREATPLLRAAGTGVILNAASGQARQGFIYTPSYAASKMGVVGLTQSLAKELAKDHIRVNAYCPGIVKTDMWAYNDAEWGKLLGDYQPGELIQEWVDDIPLGEATRPEDIANGLMFLASDAAAAITGQALNIDGGMFMN